MLSAASNTFDPHNDSVKQFVEEPRVGSRPSAWEALAPTHAPCCQEQGLTGSVWRADALFHSDKEVGVLKSSLSF